MKKNREELSRMHKETCRELKQVRAKIAEELGVELAQGQLESMGVLPENILEFPYRIG